MIKPVRERITKTVEKWYILEPLFFSAWSLHTVIPSAHVKTIRCGAGKVEYNPDFLSSLTGSQLYDVTLGGVDKHLVVENVLLDRLDKLVGSAGVPLPWP